MWKANMFINSIWYQVVLDLLSNRLIQYGVIKPIQLIQHDYTRYHYTDV